jgi:hypothetical protein
VIVTKTFEDLHKTKNSGLLENVQSKVKSWRYVSEDGKFM